MATDADTDGGAEMVEPVMYFVVNHGLQMGKGKVAAQVGHAAIMAFQRTQSLASSSTIVSNKLKRWTKGGHKKVVLRATEAKMEELREAHPAMTVAVRDYGLTQVPADSFTVLGFVVTMPGEVEELTKLKLL
jgi:PTH2 family peptidyl-tRNA hydrolase